MVGGISLGDGVSYQGGCTLEVEFGSDIGVVAMDRANADAKLIADLPVRIALGDHLQHLAFTGGERVRGGFMRALDIWK